MSDDNPCLTHLPTSQVIGLSFTAVSGFVSCLAIFFVLALVARNYLRNVKHPPPGGDWKLIRTHVDAYLLSLLASDILQGIGAILDVKWVAEKKVYCSATCTAQGAIQQIGETGVAMATFAIALHTFLVIFFRWSPGPRAAWIWRVGIAFIWVYLVLFAVIAYSEHHRSSSDPGQVDDFFTPTPFWCWISGHFNAERIAGEYFWLWLAAFTSIFLYTLLYFRVRGNITVDPQNWLRIKFKWKRWEEGDEGDGDAYYGGSGRGARGGEAGKTAAKEALSMVWYPVTYTLLVLPLSIVRWSTFRPSGHKQPDVPPVVTFIVVTIFGMSGIVNVTLMLVTRKNLLLFGQRGVINPAKIGPTVTGRLGNRALGGRGGGGINFAPARHGDGGLEEGEKKGRFAFREGRLHLGNFKGDQAHDDSTDETSAERNQGDTSFAAGRFTTQAFQTERSFDVGSAGNDRRIPGFTPTSPISPTGIPEGESFGYGIDHRLSQGDPLSMDGGIPEGMSRDLGSAGEYDIDREKEWRSFGSTPISPAYAGGGAVVGSRQQEHEISSDVGNRSNFLELSKDSRSAPGSSAEYIPSPTTYPPAPVPSSHQPRLPSGSFDPEVRRGSAASQGKASSTRRPSDTDYSVPMKFNPTPAPAPIFQSPFLDPPYNKSRNPSSKSLNKSPSTPGDSPSKSPWGPFTSLFPKSTLAVTQRPITAGSSSGPTTNHAAAPRHKGGEVETTEAQIQPLRFSFDFGPKLRSSISLVGSERDAALGRSPVEHAEHIDPLALAPTRTNTTHNSSWSRAGGRRNQRSEDGYDYRPNTAGSTRSLTSYTFGQPGFSTAPPAHSPAGVTSAGGLYTSGGFGRAEMQERPRVDSWRGRYDPADDSIGRAL